MQLCVRVSYELVFSHALRLLCDSRPSTTIRTADFSIHEPLAHVVVLRASPLGQKGLAPLLSG
jgi:hypothetical protein